MGGGEIPCEGMILRRKDKNNSSSREKRVVNSERNVRGILKKKPEGTKGKRGGRPARCEEVQKNHPLKSERKIFGGM